MDTYARPALVVCIKNDEQIAVGSGRSVPGFPLHIALKACEEYLIGQPPSAPVLARAGEIAAENCHPVSDQRGPADYKRHLAQELTTRVLRIAVSRAMAQASRADG